MFKVILQWAVDDGVGAESKSMDLYASQYSCILLKKNEKYAEIL